MFLNVEQRAALYAATHEVVSTLSVQQRTKHAEAIRTIGLFLAQPKNQGRPKDSEERRAEKKAQKAQEMELRKYIVTNLDPDNMESATVIGTTNLCAVLDLSPKSVEVRLGLNGGQSFVLNRMGFPEGMRVSYRGELEPEPVTYKHDPLEPIRNKTVQRYGAPPPFMPVLTKRRKK